MPVTKDQAQMIATLAIACRPHRAPTWDAPGVMAQLAKVANLDLAEVAMAAIRLARDPFAQTPGQIADTRAECWREVLKPPKWTPELLEPAERCRTCSKSQADCERYENHLRATRPDDAHDFEPDIRHPKDHDVSPVITELKGHLKPRPAANPHQPAHTPEPEEASA